MDKTIIQPAVRNVLRAVFGGMTVYGGPDWLINAAANPEVFEIIAQVAAMAVWAAVEKWWLSARAIGGNT